MKAIDKEELNDLREAFGKHKTIPVQYEEIVLIALSHYPELKGTQIEFQLVKKYPVPYGCRPSASSVFKGLEKRCYIITIREEADAPVKDALLKNLPARAQIGVIGHELAHVVQYQSCNCRQLLTMLCTYPLPFVKRRIERDADWLTIAHGLGNELYAHAVYIRRIPGYLEERKSLSRNYLKPLEIKQSLR